MQPNLGEFLHYMGTGAGAGVIVWALIHFLDSTGTTFSPQVKFWGALVLSFAVPALALALQVALGLAVWSSESVFEALSTGYAVSQIIHWGTGGAAQAARMDQIARDQAVLPPPPGTIESGTA